MSIILRDLQQNACVFGKRVILLNTNNLQTTDKLYFTDLVIGKIVKKKYHYFRSITEIPCVSMRFRQYHSMEREERSQINIDRLLEICFNKLRAIVFRNGLK